MFDRSLTVAALLVRRVEGVTQTRRHNAADEVTALNQTVGDEWDDPQYDAAGRDKKRMIPVMADRETGVLKPLSRSGD